jgi:simple sugar transport system ATP-binding protein
MVARMLGKTVAEAEAPVDRNGSAAVGEPVLEAHGLGRRNMLYPIDLDVRAGEQVGLAGLLGSGRSEVAQLLFGVVPRDSGQLRMKGRLLPQRFWSPRKALKAGMALIAEDRKVTGIIPDLTVRENIMLALQASEGMWKTLSRKRQQELAEHFIQLLGIKTPDGEQLVKNLSGGNQQKVLIARWLATDPQLMILDEPTRGIDVGAKAEVAALTRKLCVNGMAVIFISSELEEVARGCDRVVVLRDHRRVGELNGPEVCLAAIMQTIAGQG